jgi:hypothetical protein
MTQKMTPQDATRFEQGESATSTMILDLAAQANGCTCAAYVDWFTYRRWKAQGFQVQKGQHGVKLTTYIPVFKTENGEKVKSGVRPKAITVFCRCQLKASEKH